MVLDGFRRGLEPGLRRTLHLYWRFSRGMTLGVRALVLKPDNSVFLVEHSYVTGWHLPGGGVETGETLLQALARELAEEGNIVATAPPALHGVFLNAHASPRDHVAMFVVRKFRQDGMPTPGREIVGHGFFSPDALPADTTPGTRRRIAEVLEGAPPSELW